MLRQWFTNLPMMPERIDYPSDAPTMLIFRWPNDSGPGGDSFSQR
jgi:hypothetical protein